MSSFKLTTFNIHHGITKGEKYDIGVVLEAVKSLESDVICFQEIDKWSLRTRFHHQTRLIAEELGFNFHESRVRFHGLGFQCNSIVTKYEFVEQSSHRLFSPRFVQNRVSQKCLIDVEGALVEIINTHLHSHGRSKAKNHIAINQLRSIAEHLDKNKPTVLAGDFNLTDDDVLQVLSSHDLEVPTGFPTSTSENPKRQIDWIVGSNVVVDKVQVSEHLVGDHRALSALISIKDN